MGINTILECFSMVWCGALLTESGSLCCSKKAENSTKRSLDVPMERPCHAGTVDAGAAVGS